MTDPDPYAPRPLAGWYYSAAVASALFMALLCAMHLIHVTTDPQTLPVDERAAHLAAPAWLIALNGVAAWVGLAGGLLLLMRRRLAELTLLISLLAMLGWLAALIVVPRVRDALTSNDLAVAVALGALVWTIFWFARHSRQRGWLR